MRIAHAADLLRAAIKNREPMLLVGSPGIGKTDLVGDVAREQDQEFIVSHPRVENPTNVAGFPWADHGAKRAKFLPYGLVGQVLDTTKPTVWLWDDLGQASKDTQAAYMQWALCRKCGEHVLPDHVTIVGATNDRQHGAGASMLEPLKGRFLIAPVEPERDDWIGWAAAHRLPEDILAFIAFRPNVLNSAKPRPDIVAQPTPRGWARAARWLGYGLSDTLLSNAVSGCVGPDAATEFMGFRKIKNTLPDLDKWIKTPSLALKEMPTEVATVYAAAGGIIARFNRKSWKSFPDILDAFDKKGFAEAAALVLHAAFRQDEGISDTKEFADLVTSEFGKHLFRVKAQ